MELATSASGRTRRGEASPSDGGLGAGRGELKDPAPLDRAKQVFLAHAFVRRDESKKRVQGAEAERRMIRDGDALVSRRGRLEDDMTAFLVHNIIILVLTEPLHQPATIQVPR